MVELNKIYNEDCLEGMKLIPDKSIDMILCDLPYGTTQCTWDSVIPFDKLWAQYERIIKDNGAIVLTGSQPFTTDLINSNRKLFRYEIIWEKTQKLGFYDANRRPLKGHENILIFYKKQPIYNPQKYNVTEKSRVRKQTGSRYVGYGDSNIGEYIYDGTRYPHSVIKISNWNGALFGDNSKATKHPTQKPVLLFEWLIKTYTNEGMVILDNCMGSGTTAIACINTGRNYIGFENDANYYHMAIDRVQKHLIEKTAGIS
ncbi:site-specific DNA-methyltransferase [Candidatus Dependentiae bacterium]|nr:site-specific DNA-methyltransferase [Candidatus Dependentiae bacterium]